MLNLAKYLLLPSGCTWLKWTFSLTMNSVVAKDSRLISFRLWTSPGFCGIKRVKTGVGGFGVRIDSDNDPVIRNQQYSYWTVSETKHVIWQNDRHEHHSSKCIQSRWLPFRLAWYTDSCMLHKTVHTCALYTELVYSHRSISAHPKGTEGASMHTGSTTSLGSRVN